MLRAGNYLWVVDESMHLRNRKVTLLRTSSDLIYVSAGLDNGDLVSLTRLDSSFDSSEVRIQSTTPTNQLDRHGSPVKERADAKLEGATAAVAAETNDSSGG